MQTDTTDSVKARAVEIGTVLPREVVTRDTSAMRFRRLRSSKRMQVIVIVALLTGVVAVLGGLQIIVASLSARAYTVTTLQSLGVLLSMLTAGGLGVYLYSTNTPQTTQPVEKPITPAEVSMKHFLEVDTGAAAAYLAQGSSECPPPGVSTSGEFIVADITDEYADQLAALPKQCAETRRNNDLFPVLIGIPNTDAQTLDRVSESYATVLLVDQDQRDKIPNLLGTLTYLCARNERDRARGIGSAHVACIDISNTQPQSVGLQRDIRSRIGPALSAEARQLRKHGSGDFDRPMSDEADQERPPDLTLAVAPARYLDTVITSLSAIDDPVVAVRSEEGTTRIHIIRLYVADVLPTEELDDLWTIRQAPRQRERPLSSIYRDQEPEGLHQPCEDC